MKKYIFLILLIIVAPIFSQTLIYDQNFDGTLKPKSLTIGEKDGTEGEIADGNYIYKFNNDGNIKFNTESLGIKKLSASNFTIETKIRYEDGDDDKPFGLVLNMKEDKENFYLFSITGNGSFRIQSYFKKSYHSIAEWTKTDAIDEGGWNTLRVERTNYMARYYINGVNVYNDTYFLPKGLLCGYFLTTKGQEIEVDYLKYWESELKIDLIDNPLTDVEKIVLTELNSETSEISPTLSLDGKTIYYTRNGYPEHFGSKENQDIWYSEQENGKWLAPKLMSKPINNSGSNSIIAITPDNNTIYLMNTYDKDGNPKGKGLSVAKRNAEGWDVPTTIQIDDYYNDNKYVSFFLSQDKKILFIGAERKDTRGGIDLYVSFRKSDKNYSAPINIGDSINTFSNDFNPYLAADNTTLYYITAGLPGYGREDVWVTKRLDDTWLKWSKPKI